MSRKLLSLLLILTLALPLFASVTVTDATGEAGAYRAIVEETLDKEFSKLWGDQEFAAEITSLTTPFEGVDVIAVAFDGREYQIAIDKEKVSSSIKNGIADILLYAIDGGDEAALDYIYLSSCSSVSLPKAWKGTLYYLKAPSGKTLADFVLTDWDEGVSELEPVYISRAYTGLALEKGLSLQLRANAGMIFSPSFKMSARVNVKMTNLLYPFNPSLGFMYLNNYYGDNAYFGMIGIEYVMPLASVFTARFTLIQDAGLLVNASVLLGYDGDFTVGCDIFIAYQHFITAHICWNAGASYTYAVSKSLEWYPTVPQMAFQIGMGVIF